MSRIALLSIVRIFVALVRNTFLIMGIFFLGMLMNLHNLFDPGEIITEKDSYNATTGMLMFCLILSLIITSAQFIINKWHEREQRIDDIKYQIYSSLGYYKVSKNKESNQ